MLAKHEQNRIDQEARIARAALTLMGERGFDSVTMAEIAAEAGVSRGTVFNRFGSKHAIVEAITATVFTTYQHMLQKALDDPRTPTPLLIRALFEQMGVRIEQWHGFFGHVFREIARLQVGLSEGGPSARAREGALAILAKLLERGQVRGDLAAGHPPVDLARAFDSLVNGTITHWLYDDRSESLSLRMRLAAELYLNGAGVASGSTDEDSALPNLHPDGFGEPGADPAEIFHVHFDERSRT
jgi:AcrR family transcriptional regulator